MSMFGKDKKKDNRHQRIGGTDIMDMQALRSDYGRPEMPVQITPHERVAPDFRARFAMECIGRWAMIAGEPDGEDSSGRAKNRRATPSEITEHACAVAEAAFAAFKERGWLAEVPAYAELIEKVKDRENAND